MFITSTTLLLTTTRPFIEVQTEPGIIETVADFLALVPVPPNPLEGAYQLRYNLRCVYEIHLLGESPTDGNLIVNINAWQTAASRDGGDPPDMINTFVFSIGHRGSAASWETFVRRVIEKDIVKRSIVDRVGDRRDVERIRTATTSVESGRPYLELLHMNGEVVQRGQT